MSSTCDGDKKWHNSLTKSRKNDRSMGTEVPSQFDVIIIGGGPAGMSASLWCAELGLTSIIIEKEPELGGQLLWTFNAINNYLGVKAKNGRELCDTFLEHLGTRAFYKSGCEASAVDLSRKRIFLSDGTTYIGNGIILATGVRRRKLDVAGEAVFEGRGMLRSGAENQLDMTGKVVLIVGGGDAALENALILANQAQKVYVVHRRSEFTARGEFVERASNHHNIEFVFSSNVAAILGGDRVEAVELEGVGGRRTVAVDLVLVRIGVIPNTKLFSGQISMDVSGYLLHQGYETNITNVFAVGDVANPQSPTIVTAVGSAASAIKSFRNRTNRLGG